mgnify:FL=1
MKFYTWKDIERYVLINHTIWDSALNNIEVYPDEIILYPKEENSSLSHSILHDLFPKNITSDYSALKLDRPNTFLSVSYDYESDTISKNTMPLFKKAIYENSVYPTKILSELKCPVIAFHSYKGGVGRTLSLIAFARAWTNIQSDPQHNKLLIIDSDLEAPGLTLIQGQLNETSFSYLDLLTLIQDNNNIEDIVSTSAELMGTLTFPIETSQQRVDHFFLPTYRYEQQLFDLYASPQTITTSRNKEYFLAEVLSQLASHLGVSAVLVDLRAGISEYSAPLLLDPRVKKYCVTSTSLQSVIGTSQVLNFISKGLAITEDALLPTIFLNMIPDSFSTTEKDQIKDRLTSCFQTTETTEELLDNMIVELPFASELIHLASLRQILSVLKDRDMYYTIEKLVLQYYQPDRSEEVFYTELQHKTILKQIHAFSDKQITAEANGAEELLLTEPIKNLCTRFSNQLPTTVVQGAKGSGKTFLYRQLIEKENWNAFCSEIIHKNITDDNGYFIPVLAPQNISELRSSLTQCIDKCNEIISFANISRSVYIDNTIDLDSNAAKELDWMSFWEQLFVKSVNSSLDSFAHLNEELKKEQKSIVFLIDGLEEILKLVFSNKNQQKAIEVLCQGVLNMIAAKYENIGLIIFLRSDMAQNAITVNYEQFKQAFNYAELKWSSDEALKLAVWIVSHAVDDFYKENTPIENSSQEIINQYLEKLWGLKLGKKESNEAYSSRWILAALSDFNGQLQARDIIRFLKYASKSNDKKPPYNDRILMPAEIRNAVSNCSKDKIKEIKAEYENLKPIFEKLENLSSEKKTLPMNLEEDALTASEEKSMIQSGYLTRDGEKLYLPEIIRHALGFRYERGARPRVLSLLLKH